MQDKPTVCGTLFAEGPDNARVFLVGQNPGREEVRQNRPFVGRAGKYLDQVLHRNGINRQDLYLTSVVKAPTPGNRKPTAAEINRWMPFLIREIQEIGPEIVVLMGTVAWQTPRQSAIEYLETYHPAAAMRFPKIKEKFERDMEILGRKIQQLNP
jgi:DNA polymerase